jgi:hypothetical protein
MANTLKLGAGKWATGTDTVLAFNDENNNFKPLPFSFSRASSATVVNQSGLIETVGSGEPRIDFQGNTKGAMLLEPSRTNSILQSNQFDTTWTISNASVVGNQSGIYNTTDAWKLVGNGNNNDKVLQNVASGTSTFSIYAKAGNLNFTVISLGNGFAYYNIETGVVTSSSGVVSTNIESIGNEWYRLSITVALTSSSNVQVYIASADGSVVTNNGDFIYLQHAQLEVGSYATSIIPTQGSAVTRLAESCSQTVPDGVIGQTEGTVYVDFLSVNNFDGSSGNLFQIKEDNNNRINIYFSNGTPRLFGIENSSGLFNQSLSLITGSVCKLAIKYNSTSTKVFINGSLSHTLSGINNIAFNDFIFSPNNNINYNEIKLYNTALTDAQAIALTQV